MSEPSSDEEAIRRTLAGYCQTCDDGRFTDFALLFAEDASYQVSRGGPVVGREAIAQFMERAMPPERRGKHLCGEPLISISGDTAEVTTDFLFVARLEKGGWGVTAVGRYDDRLQRTTDQGWLFAFRSINLL